MRTFEKGFVLSLASLLVLASLSGCKKNEGGPASSSSNSDLSNDTSVTPSETYGFAVTVKANEKYTYYTHEMGAFANECKISKAQQAGTDPLVKDILCYVDSPEMDLYYHGAELRYNVPASMCSYFVLHLPYYYATSPGTGPLLFQYWVSSTGQIGTGPVADGTLSSPGVIGVTQNGAGTDGSMSTDLTPTCAYDYSADGGPNCCEGQYSIMSTAWDSSATTPGWAQPQITQGEWGGQASNCLRGPAMDSLSKDEQGYPVAKVFYVEGEGKSDTITIKAPLNSNHKSADGSLSNLYAANYFDVADGNANGLSDELSDSSNWPFAMQEPPAAADAGREAYPYFEFSCYDRAFEMTARIRLMIREWNLYTKWQSKTANGWDSVAGTEIDGVINDFSDWADGTNFTAYPGL